MYAALHNRASRVSQKLGAPGKLSPGSASEAKESESNSRGLQHEPLDPLQHAQHLGSIMSIRFHHDSLAQTHSALPTPNIIFCRAQALSPQMLMLQTYRKSRESSVKAAKAAEGHRKTEDPGSPGLKRNGPLPRLLDVGGLKGMTPLRNYY